MLRLLDVDAKALREEFPQNIVDVDLFPQLKDTGWIFVTADRQIQRRSAEALALKQAGVSAIFFQRFWLKTDRWRQANWLTKHWQKIDAYVEDLDPPIYIEVASNAKIQRLSL